MRKSACLVALATVLAAVGTARPAQAQQRMIFTVTRTVDDINPGSLRWAIGQANANGVAGDTINFQLGSGPYTITLTSSLPPIGANVPGLTIDASSISPFGTLTVDGNHQWQVFQNLGNLTIGAVTIANGLVTGGGGGGGVYNQQNATLTLRSCVFRGCGALGAAGAVQGAGLNQSATGGARGFGGAVRNNGALSATQTVFLGNIATGGVGAGNVSCTASGGGAGMGGALYNGYNAGNTGASAFLDECFFSGNGVVGGAGGVGYTSGGGGAGMGGAIFCRVGTVTVQRCTFTQNGSAGGAGGASLAGGTWPGVAGSDGGYGTGGGSAKNGGFGGGGGAASAASATGPGLGGGMGAGQTFAGFGGGVSSGFAPGSTGGGGAGFGGAVFVSFSANLQPAATVNLTCCTVDGSLLSGGVGGGAGAGAGSVIGGGVFNVNGTFGSYFNTLTRNQGYSNAYAGALYSQNAPGGGAGFPAGTATNYLYESVFAQSVTTSGAPPFDVWMDSAGTLSGRDNFVTAWSGTGSGVNPPPGLVVPGASGADPQIGPLTGANGSPSLPAGVTLTTRLPLAGSPLMDAGNAMDASNLVTFGTDERAFPRNDNTPPGPSVDIGALEFQLPFASTFAVSATEGSTLAFTANQFAGNFLQEEPTRFNVPLANVTITSLPVLGTLFLSNPMNPVVLNQNIPVASLGNLRYQPYPEVGNPPAADTFNWTANDGTYPTQNVATVNITVTNVAPTLNPSAIFELAAITENTSGMPGTLVRDLIQSASTVTTPNAITDPGSPNGVSDGRLGIAVTSAPLTNGMWFFTTDGTNWQTLTSAGQANAVLLAADSATRVRFIPFQWFNGTISTLQFRAWDRSAGNNGDTNADTTVSGGSSAFSTGQAIANLRVQPLDQVGVPFSFPATVVSRSTGLATPFAVTIDPGAVATGATFSNGVFRWTPPIYAMGGSVSRVFNVTFTAASGSVTIPFTVKDTFGAQINSFIAWVNALGTQPGVDMTGASASTNLLRRRSLANNIAHANGLLRLNRPQDALRALQSATAAVDVRGWLVPSRQGSRVTPGTFDFLMYSTSEITPGISTVVNRSLTTPGLYAPETLGNAQMLFVP